MVFFLLLLLVCIGTLSYLVVVVFMFFCCLGRFGSVMGLMWGVITDGVITCDLDTMYRCFRRYAVSGSIGVVRISNDHSWWIDILYCVFLHCLCICPCIGVGGVAYRVCWNCS